MATSDDALRRSLEAATLGLASMAVMMTQLGDLLAKWQERAAAEMATNSAKTWQTASDELREVVATSGTGTRAAAFMVRDPQRESSLTTADLRRRYDG